MKKAISIFLISILLVFLLFTIHRQKQEVEHLKVLLIDKNKENLKLNNNLLESQKKLAIAKKLAELNAKKAFGLTDSIKKLNRASSDR